MKILALLFVLLVPCASFAQSAQLGTAEQQVFSQRIISLTGESVQWQIKATELQHKVDDLQKQLDAIKKPAEAPHK